MLRTFHEWSNSGYKIKKGAKAKGRTTAGFLFDSSQVIYSPRRSSYSSNPDGDWDSKTQKHHSLHRAV